MLREDDILSFFYDSLFTFIKQIFYCLFYFAYSATETFAKCPCLLASFYSMSYTVYFCKIKDKLV